MKQDIAAYRAAEATAAALRRGMGDQLLTLYLFGSLTGDSYRPGRSDVNLLAVVDDRASIHEVRAAFRPAWRKHGKTLQRAPMVMASSSPRTTPFHQTLLPAPSVTEPMTLALGAIQAVSEICGVLPLTV